MLINLDKIQNGCKTFLDQNENHTRWIIFVDIDHMRAAILITSALIQDSGSNRDQII